MRCDSAAHKRVDVRGPSERSGKSSHTSIQKLYRVPNLLQKFLFRRNLFPPAAFFRPTSVPPKKILSPVLFPVTTKSVDRLPRCGSYRSGPSARPSPWSPGATPGQVRVPAINLPPKTPARAACTLPAPHRRRSLNPPFEIIFRIAFQNRRRLVPPSVLARHAPGFCRHAAAIAHFSLPLPVIPITSLGPGLNPRRPSKDLLGFRTNQFQIKIIVFPKSLAPRARAYGFGF